MIINKRLHHIKYRHTAKGQELLAEAAVKNTKAKDPKNSNIIPVSGICQKAAQDDQKHFLPARWNSPAFPYRQRSKAAEER